MSCLTFLHTDIKIEKSGYVCLPLADKAHSKLLILTEGLTYAILSQNIDKRK